MTSTADAATAAAEANIAAVGGAASLDTFDAYADQQQKQRATKGWTPEGVKKLLDSAHPDFAKYIKAEGITIIRFDTAYDKWKYTGGARQGQTEESELRGLQGNSAGDNIRLRTSLSDAEAVMTLIHELYHHNPPTPTNTARRLEDEVQARIYEDGWARKLGLPPSNPNYRNADGTTNKGYIRQQINNSTHYNPQNKTRIGRRYVGETTIPFPWSDAVP